MSVDTKKPSKADDANDSLSTLLSSAVLDGGAGPAPAKPSFELREQALHLIARDATLRTRRRIGLCAIGIATVAALGFAAPTLFRRAAPIATSSSSELASASAPEPATAEGRVGDGNDPTPPPPMTVDVSTLPLARSADHAPVAKDPKRPAAGVPPPASTDAEDLLRTANRLRGEKQWEDAMRTYERVIREHPGSDPAYAAMIAAASLRLSRAGDAREALRLYERALALHPGGELSEEALWGTCVARRALGEHLEEREALQRFTARYPSSWRASEAAERLSQLGERPR